MTDGPTDGTGEDAGADAKRAEAIGDAVTEAESLGNEERWEDARDLLLESLQEHGDDAYLLGWLGIVSERLGEEGEAYEFFRRCLALEPTDPFLLTAAGSGVALYDDPEAERALRLAALTAPNEAFTRYAYGSYLAHEGMYDVALTELRAARDLAPDDAAVRAELGVALLMAKHPDEGLNELEEALSHGDEAWLRGLFGLALWEAGRTEEGAEQLHRASSERVEDVELQLLSSLASAGEGWMDEAWNALARAETYAESGDRELILEVEEALGEGDEAAAELLREYLGPTLLRDRLHQRA